MELYMPQVIVWFCKECGWMSCELMKAPTNYTSWEYFSFYEYKLPHFPCKRCGATNFQRFPNIKTIEHRAQRINALHELSVFEQSILDQIENARLIEKRKNLYKSR